MRHLAAAAVAAAAAAAAVAAAATAAAAAAVECLWTLMALAVRSKQASERSVRHSLSSLPPKLHDMAAAPALTCRP